MLRSSINRLARAFAPTLRLGLHIDRTQISLIESVAATPTLHVVGVAQRKLATPWFGETPSAAARTALTEALASLPQLQRREFYALNISLPEPAVQYASFEFDDLPKDARAAANLVHWRFAQTLHAPEDHIETRYQRWDRAGESPWVFASACDRAWVALLREVLDAARLLPACIDSGAMYRFNFFPELRISGAAGALLSITPSDWTLCFWDEQARVRFVRSRWRDEAQDAQALAKELAWVMQAYSGAGGERSCTALHVLAPPALSEKTMLALKEVLAVPVLAVSLAGRFSADAALKVDEALYAAVFAAGVVCN